MTSPVGSKAHLRLVKKFPGHPPSGAMVPSAVPAVPANVILQKPAFGTASTHRPVMVTGVAPPGRAAPSGAAPRSVGGPGDENSPPRVVALSQALSTTSVAIVNARVLHHTIWLLDNIGLSRHRRNDKLGAFLGAGGPARGHGLGLGIEPD